MLAQLREYPWQPKYSPDTCENVVEAFYIPALCCAIRYWRTTGYFQATALAMAMRGIEGLIRNRGQMRLIVGCTLAPEEALAIARGHELRQVIHQHLVQIPLEPPDRAAEDALELLAWMIQQQILDVQVAIPCDAQRQPLAGTVLFHEKAGILEDRVGDRLAFNGGINETLQGWRHNWDSFHVYTSWQLPEHVEAEEQSFARLWQGRSRRALVLSVPAALEAKLLPFAPPSGQLPRRLRETPTLYTPQVAQPAPTPDPPLTASPRALVWHYLYDAPRHSPAGDRVGEATCAVKPWPHQIRAFQRLWQRWPPKLLIADEVGLGKTIQAGLLLRQAWLSGRAKRILILAPAALLQQWQVELREKFNLHWPIYDGKALRWLATPGWHQPTEQTVSRDQWHQQPCVLVSSQLVRRQERSRELLQAEPWDLVILDEAHHARRQGLSRDRPNQLLRLMQQLKDRTQGLVLLTATPMQVDPIEVWDLLNLLGLPPEWTAEQFCRFFELTTTPAPSRDDWQTLAHLFKAMERYYGPMPLDIAQQYVPQRRIAQKILTALRDVSSIPLQKLESDQRQAALRILRAYSPVRLLISRHTRDLLRAYHRAGKLTTPIAQRHVQDEFIFLSAAERQVYEAVEDYIATTYNNAAAGDRNAIGFVMTIYRKRLASSFYALAQTLGDRLAKLQGASTPSLATAENLADELEAGIESDHTTDWETAALNYEEANELEKLLRQVQALPTDTKTQVLKRVIQQLQTAGYPQVIVFTQFTDTLDFLRQELTASMGLRILCFSGRGGEVFAEDKGWLPISREETKRRFRDRAADVLLCTDAAAEGLNFQFCGALINYDLPWNPMRVEQRIGRIDRLGQAYPQIQIYNLHYADTVETDVFLALSDRIAQFKTFVGNLQPILSLQPVLANLQSTITTLIFSRRQERQQQQAQLVEQLAAMAATSPTATVDLDPVPDLDLSLPPQSEPAYTLADLRSLLEQPHLLPPGVTVQVGLDRKDVAYLAPGLLQAVRVTTDPEYYDQHCDSVELWSPGNPLFPKLEMIPEPLPAQGLSRGEFLGLLGDRQK
ncbi:DEAD/DEAH box helicase family protein [Thermosynechococcus sichuanensis E542]|uniref:DEAD/DEAH box helicase family protein n=1 Tax=Thermosynechococcus sichuanensis E542 TaxID=2016101 RepID=A0A7D6EWI4_9CYAN|nr:SNF2-related protein [Thermosynechococcus vestitus]QLL29624.1 DEAD/DEAH box helicase family protein [Thermosynechococcus vestitus E542]